MIPPIDHLVVSAPTLEEGMQWAENTLGVTPQPGGVHEGYGTHNVLVGLGPYCYLEIIAKDPKQKEIPHYWIPAHREKSTKLIGWASTHSSLDFLTRTYDNYLGAHASMQRGKLDGTRIEWEMSYPRFEIYDGLVPFFINWKESIHPGATLHTSGQISSFSLKHPDYTGLQQALTSLGFDIQVEHASQAEILCTLTVGSQEIQL
jgi:hypothetical protein